jgi:hypothetical protein
MSGFRVPEKCLKCAELITTSVVNSIKVFYVNMRIMVYKLDELELFLRQSSFDLDILAFSETWLKSNSTFNLSDSIGLESYNSFQNFRPANTVFNCVYFQHQSTYMCIL